jgi:hypothetical protein
MSAGSQHGANKKNEGTEGALIFYASHYRLYITGQRQLLNSYIQTMVYHIKRFLIWCKVGVNWCCSIFYMLHREPETIENQGLFEGATCYLFKIGD